MALAAEAATIGRTIPVWRSKLLKSLAQNKRLANSRYVQLATVRPDNRPANRTVVFRGFLSDDDDSLTFVTDSRSRKVGEVAVNPAAEVAWYFPETREQYRVSGNLTIVDAASTDSAMQAARKRVWHNMSDPGRQQFAWPHPGLPRHLEDPTAWDCPAPGPKDPVLDTFCLVVLHVDEVEQLKLKSNERFLYRRQEAAAVPADEGAAAVTWVEEPINP
eukprot:XP_001700070.1 pyridoxamine 5' phosphate oxidase-related protein [Chlamydomonas reinhardtii]